MADKEVKNGKIKIITGEIDCNKYLTRIVGKNNISSGKIQLPKDLIGRKVYVVWKE